MYTLLSGPMVYTIFPCFPLCDLGVGRQTEKRGVPRWCILFFRLFLRVSDGGVILVTEMAVISENKRNNGNNRSSGINRGAQRTLATTPYR